MTKAVYFLGRALNKVDDQSDRAEINNMLLDLHEKFGEIEKHLKVAENQHVLYEQKILDEVLSKNFKYHLKKDFIKYSGKN